MIYDLHVHSEFSCDSEVAMEVYCEKAIAGDVSLICFTDHVDFNKNDFGSEYYKADAFFRALDVVKKKYGERLKILAGIEFSEPHLYKEQLKALSNYPYDYIIGSIHWVRDMFPQQEVRNRYSAEIFYGWYWQEVLKAVTYGHFDSIGHLDFPKRYYGELQFKDQVISQIFRMMVEKNIALEINTSSLRKGFEKSMPDIELLSIYKACGGKLVTIGSDAHLENDLVADFQYANNLASKYGLTRVFYENRNAILIP